MVSRFLSLFVLAVIASAAALPGVFTLPVLDRDEALYAHASAQMFELGPESTPACLTEHQAARSPVPTRFVAICFGDEPRNKKPIGAYWAQVAALAYFAPDSGARAIWVHRIPSILGAILAAWGTYAAGCSLIGRRGAFLGACLFAVTLLMGVEGGIARTDALLTGVTTLAMAALARLYITQSFYTQGAEVRPDAMVRAVALGFWVAMAAAVLIKGPMAPFVVVCTLAALFVLDRRMGWLMPLFWWPGLLVFIVLTVPWFVLITGLSEGSFSRESLVEDVIGKFTSAQETHYAPPFSHAAWALVLFFPGTFVLLPGLVRTLRAVAHTWLIRFWALSVVGVFGVFVFQAVDFAPAVNVGLMLALAGALYLVIRVFEATAGKTPPDQEAGGLQFLLAWGWLAWVVLELAPTKLPHYTLTLYPALALMGGGALAAMQERRAGSLTWGLSVVSWLVFLVGACVAVGVCLVAGQLGGPAWTAIDGASVRAIADFVVRQGADFVADLPRRGQVLAAGIVLVLGLGPLVLLLLRSARGVVALLVVAGIGWHVAMLHVILPQQAHVFASERIGDALRSQSLHPVVSRNARPPLAVLGYGEPSLTYLTHGALIVFSPNGEDADDVMAKARGAAEVGAEEAGRAIVVDRRYDAALLRALAELGATAVPAGDAVAAFNYSTGEEIELLIYRINRASPARVPQ